MQIRNYRQRDLDAVVRLSLRAWAPIHVRHVRTRTGRTLRPDIRRG